MVLLNLGSSGPLDLSKLLQQNQWVSRRLSGWRWHRPETQKGQKIYFVSFIFQISPNESDAEMFSVVLKKLLCNKKTS